MCWPVSSLHSFADVKCFTNCSLERQLNISGMISFGISRMRKESGIILSIVTTRHQPIASEMCWATEDDEEQLSSHLAAVRENLVIHVIQGDYIKIIRIISEYQKL